MSDQALTLPQDLDAERAVLGAILVDNTGLHLAQSAGLTAEHFYRDAHRRVYRVLEALSARKSALDFVTVKYALAGDLDEVGVSYLAGLVDGGIRGMNLPHYVALVQETSQRRALITQARAVIEQALAGEETAARVIDDAVAGFLRIGEHRQAGQLVEGAQLAKDAYAYLEALQQRRADRQTAGTPTGFVDLDALLDGFQPGHLIVLAGRTSEGKSALALQFALASASCAYFSCEMERGELAIRELAVLARVNGWAMRRGLLSSREQAAVGRALDHLAEAGVAIDDTPAISLAQIRARARRRQVTVGLRLIVVDYLQLCAAESKRKDQTREQDVAGIVRGLKALAMELKVPVVALSQFSRALETGKRPELHHLRESGEIEQAANVVLFIFRADGKTVADAGEVEIIVAKNRGGPKGTATLQWHPEQTRFADREAAYTPPEQGALV